MAVCDERDTKCLYLKARVGQITNFIDFPSYILYRGIVKICNQHSTKGSSVCG